MYIEIKTPNYGNDGPAWIGRVQKSRTGKTIYFNGMAFGLGNGGMVIGGNAINDSGDTCWISRPKQDQSDRRYSEPGVVMIERACLKEYLEYVDKEELPVSRYQIVDVVETDIQKFHTMANEKLTPQ